jgi:hypothetical protein
MSSRELGASLLEALHGLENTARELRLAAQQRYEPRLESLQQAIEALGLSTIAQPPHGSDEYLRDWQQYLADAEQRLTPRALRYLCWEPDVATASRFQDYLDQGKGELSVRALQGLVRSCHACWSPAFAAGGIARQVQQRLGRYRGTHRVLVHWREHAAMLLGSQGHCIFADSLLAARLPIKTYCDEWAIEESSQYVLEALRQAVRACQESLEREAALRTYLLTTLLPWTGWPVQDFHAVIGTTILHPVTTRALGLQEALIKVVLSDPRLGDPRLPRNAKNWLGIQEARQRFLQWLSRADINFFFEHVLPEGQDPHGRKAFWLRYVSRVLMSRPLLNRDDEGRIRVTMQSLQEQIGHFGRIHGATSAFLLDFGPLVVVEFSQAGNACYLYEKSSSDKVITDFWSPEVFTVWGLKRRALATRVNHSHRWQTTLEHLLAQYGIRPA